MAGSTPARGASPWRCGAPLPCRPAAALRGDCRCFAPPVGDERDRQRGDSQRHRRARDTRKSRQPHRDHNEAEQQPRAKRQQGPFAVAQSRKRHNCTYHERAAGSCNDACRGRRCLQCAVLGHFAAPPPHRATGSASRGSIASPSPPRSPARRSCRASTRRSPMSRCRTSRAASRARRTRSPGSSPPTSSPRRS